MPASLINFGIKQYLHYRYRRIRAIHQSAPALQADLLRRLISQCADTRIGREYRWRSHGRHEQLLAHLPLHEYEDFYPYIDRMLRGEERVTYYQDPKYFAKSSGTTNDRSKYIPVTEDMIQDNFIATSWDAMAMVYHQRPEARLFADKSLLIGGTIQPHHLYPEVTVGDVSAIMLHEMPAIGRPFYTPDFETAIMDDFEAKLARMARITAGERVTMFGGVPTWIIVLFRLMLEQSGKDHMGEVWPDARLYMHGGVGFEPYRSLFEGFFPSPDFDYMEVYNASEGYIGMQDILGSDDMLLMVDNGIYYEFVPLTDYHQNKDTAIPLEGVEVGVTYVLVMSSIAGLWRYIPGDTVVFTSTAPYRLKVAGRTSQYINVFGEEVMVANTEAAIAAACQRIPARISDYTVAPVYLEGEQKGRHQWVVEFDEAPADLGAFAKVLDEALRAVNADYDAKRYLDLAMVELDLHVVAHGTFARWLESRGRRGAQVKVPRLSNDRTVVEEVLQMEGAHLSKKG